MNILWASVMQVIKQGNASVKPKQIDSNVKSNWTAYKYIFCEYVER